MNAIAKISPAKRRSAELEREITQLASNINAANYKLLRLIEEFDAIEGWGEWGCKSCAHWLNWKCGIAMGAAREKVRVARALPGLPKVSEAFANGQLSYSKARAITRIASEENEDTLLMIAAHGSASHVEKTVRGFRRASNQQTQAAHNERTLDYFWDEDGHLQLRATLSAEQGALFLKALETAMATLEADEWKTANEEQASDKYVPAETLPAGTEGLAIEKPARRKQLRADALAMMAEQQLESRAGSCKTADRFQVVVHADVSKVVPQLSIENGPSIPEQTVERLCCDASISHILSQNGEPVSIGRKSRTIPPPMRRALELRDGGCRFPGCCSTKHVDGHHIKHWSHGGETSLNNLVLLCRHHHRLVHEGGYAVQRGSNGEFQFFRPGGQRIPEVYKAPKVSGIADVPCSRWQWNGDVMDYGIAVEGLLHARARAQNVPAETR